MHVELNIPGRHLPPLWPSSHVSMMAVRVRIMCVQLCGPLDLVCDYTMTISGSIKLSDMIDLVMIVITVGDTVQEMVGGLSLFPLKTVVINSRDLSVSLVVVQRQCQFRISRFMYRNY